MKFKQYLFIIIAGTVFLFFSCKGKSDKTNNKLTKEKSITIAIRSDIDFFNPLYSSDINSGLINDLIFGALTYSEFDTSKGELTYLPYLASRWEISKDKRSITFTLNTELKWSDGHVFSAYDVQYSYLLYTHPDVMSVRQDFEKYFFKQKNGVIDYKKSFQIINDSTIKFNFIEEVDDPLFVTGLPILPKHVFDTIPFNRIFYSEINFKPVGIGPYVLENHIPRQQVILRKNDSTRFNKIPKIEKLIFKVISDYNSRINQLKNGEIDLVTDIRPEDAKQIETNFQNIKIDRISGRDYDYIGWNNIEINIFQKSGGKIINAHPLFGSKKVRQALTYAINRIELLENYFGKFAILAENPISPIFKILNHDETIKLEYNPQKAKQLLTEEGWQDTDNDKILDKNGIPFKFKLSIASGKPHREFSATLIKNYLSQVGIIAEIEVLEPSVFFSKMFERKLDAWIAGWTVPLKLDLAPFWSSALDKNPFNVVGFRNFEVDKILMELPNLHSYPERKSAIQKFSQMIQDEQPVTFLYWIDNIIGYNKKIKNIKLNPIGYTNRIWEWYISE